MPVSFERASERSLFFKNFKISAIEKGKRFRDYYNPLDWLRDARIIYPSDQLKEHVTLPLKENEESLFRIYLADCGLFALQSGISPQTMLEGNLHSNTLSGIFFENYVADELSVMNLNFSSGKAKQVLNLNFSFRITEKSFRLTQKRIKVPFLLWENTEKTIPAVLPLKSAGIIMGTMRRISF